MSHLTRIYFKNFRIFNDETIFDLAPITFLTGPNSSGKSSVLKALLLLKSNYNSDLQVLDFSGPKHNLGSFENTLNRESSNRESLAIGLQTSIGSSKRTGYMQSTFYRQPITTKRSVYSVLKEFNEGNKTVVTLELNYFKNDRSGKLKQINLFHKEEGLLVMSLNIGDAQSDAQHTLYMDIEKIEKDKNLSSVFFQPLQLLDLDQESKRLRSKVKTKTVKSSVYSVSPENGNEVYLDEPIAVFKSLYEKFLLESFDLKSRKVLHPLILSMPLRRILKDFSEIADNLEYMEAVRANSRRIYTNDSQGTSFNELILEYRSRNISPESLKFTNKWLQKFEIADEIVFENIEGVATTIFLSKNGCKIALADMGYGVTQFLPMVLKIALEEPIREELVDSLIVVKKTLLLEEPETNLHPKLQSLIADFLIDAVKTFEIRFVVETHSEYIIRKMQVLVAERKTKASDIGIYYFNDRVDEDHKKIYKIEIRNNGSLSEEFGAGFFDEATNLKLELLKSKIAK